MSILQSPILGYQAARTEPIDMPPEQAPGAVLGSAAIGNVNMPPTTIGGVSMPETTISGVSMPTTTIGGLVMPETILGSQSTGLGVLPLSALPPQSFTGIGAGYGLPAAAAPPVVAPTATATPAAPPRGAQAPRAAGPAKLSEIGQIQTALAKQGEQAAADMYGIARQQNKDVEATTAAAQQAETETIKLQNEAAETRRDMVQARETDANTERETRRLAALETSGKLQTAQDELENTKLDIDAAYGGAAGRIFSGLAVALGSFGASMTGGPNYALQIVNDRINRELDGQKSEIDKKKGKVTELGRLLQQNENLLGDATAARKLAQAQTELALAAKAEALTKERDRGPRQQAVIDALRTRAGVTMRDLQTVMETKSEETLMIGARERQAQRVAAAAAAAKERERVRALNEKKADQDFDLTKIIVKGDMDQRAAGATAGKEMTGRTTDMGKALQADGVVFTADLYQRLAKNLGMDPVTGKPTGEAPGVGWANMGSLTNEGAQNRQDLEQFVEMGAKAAGGPITASDRESARDLVKGIGTTDAIRRGVFSVGQRLGANIRTRAASDPAAMAALQGQIPILKTMQNIGQQDAAVAAGGFSPAPPPAAK